MASTLFISDLHLDLERPDLTRAFLDFLSTRATQAEALYILGDFFEVWLGDDDKSPLIEAVSEGLLALAQSGVRIYLQHGNRDFLIGQDFAERAGVTLLPDPCVVDLYNEPVLLMHGDSLCTRDEAYLAFRQQVRNPAWQQQFLSQPLDARRAFAAKARAESKAQSAGKDLEIMDVTPEEVEKALTEHKVLRMIHGHTHRPHRHSISLENKKAERIVLGDWDKLGWCLEVHSSQQGSEKYCLENWQIV